MDRVTTRHGAAAGDEVVDGSQHRAPSSPTAGPGPPQHRYRESGLNFQTGIARLPVIQTKIQGQI
eukprot:4644479-Prymnesium_polylepis.1